MVAMRAADQTPLFWQHARPPYGEVWLDMG